MGATTKQKAKATQRTRNEILAEFHQRCDVTRKAQNEGLLDYEDAIEIMDGYRVECEEALMQVKTDEASRKKRHAKILLTHEKEVDQFLKELLAMPLVAPPKVVEEVEDDEEEQHEEQEDE